MTFIFPAPATPSLPIAGSDQHFPVRRIFCVGRNYAAHAQEMGHGADRAAPFYFTKAAHHMLPAHSTLPMASLTQDYHHEIELVVALHSGGANLEEAGALAHVFGYGVGLDMTRRDLQATAKDKRRPWDVAKDVEASAVCSALTPVTPAFNPQQGTISLKKNGALAQTGELSDQIWRVDQLIADLSRLYTLQAGDLIFTGTPAGVGPVRIGDRLEGHISGLVPFDLTVTS